MSKVKKVVSKVKKVAYGFWLAFGAWGLYEAHWWSYVDWAGWYMWPVYWVALSGLLFGTFIELDHQAFLTDGDEYKPTWWWMMLLVALGGVLTIVFIVTSNKLAKMHGDRDPKVLAARLKRSKQDA